MLQLFYILTIYFSAEFVNGKVLKGSDNQVHVHDHNCTTTIGAWYNNNVESGKF